MAKKPADPVKLNLRFTEGLRLRLEKQAEANNRSMNEEIIRRLEESFKGEDVLDALTRMSEKMGDKMTFRAGHLTLKKGKWTRGET